MGHTQSEAPNFGNILSAVFLVGGTCIGGGMLALPLSTGISGFFPSIAIMFVCWFAMTFTALLLLEVSMWMEAGVHVITMTTRILGLPGKMISWLLYLFICYASLVAYTAGGGVQIATGISDYFGLVISKDMGAVIFILFFGFVLFLGSKIVGRVNAILFVAMIVAYVVLIGMGVTEVKKDFLFNRRWASSILAVPLMLTAFSFQTMVPSLTEYLDRNVKALRIAVIGGSAVAFIIYAIWQWFILGIVPVEGTNGLAEALARGEPPTQFLREHVASDWIYLVAEYFAFFAIITSFLGIGFGLYDFLSDGLKIKKVGFGRIFLGLLIVIPTIIFATQFERVFLVALEISGGFGDSILNGIIPILMVWLGRYYLHLDKNETFTVPGGKPLLAIVFVFFALAFTLQIVVQTTSWGQVFAPYEVPVHNVKDIGT